MEGAGTPVFNPSLGEVIAEVPAGGAALVDEAAQAAAEAFPGWWRTPAVDRIQFLLPTRRFSSRMPTRSRTLISTEHGKTLSESRGDLRRGIQIVEFACGIRIFSWARVWRMWRGASTRKAIRQPLGVCAGITPFNFPAMVPLWMFPIAIACGNTFILKPSERVPLTAVRLRGVAC